MKLEELEAVVGKIDKRLHKLEDQVNPPKKGWTIVELKDGSRVERCDTHGYEDGCMLADTKDGFVTVYDFDGEDGMFKTYHHQIISKADIVRYYKEYR